MPARSRLLLPICLLVTACDTEPVRWEATTPLEAEPVTAQPTSDAPPPTLPPAALPDDPRGHRCDASVRLAPLGGGHVVAV